ncbi:MAG: hypothetical protein J6C51_00255 [Clostridia bacterium]|nr:hypothetical protein [Clostridia bacterium]
MKIVVVNPPNKDIRLTIPTGLVLNRLTAAIAPCCLQNCGVNITGKQAAAFIRELNRFRRAHPEWVLVEVQSADGEYVKVKL